MSDDLKEFIEAFRKRMEYWRDYTVVHKDTLKIDHAERDVYARIERFLASYQEDKMWMGR